MPSETEATSPEPDGLQFDHAEFDNNEESVEVLCASCKQEIVDQYYEINGTIFCESCKALIEAHLRSGSGFGRFLKATVLGMGAAIVGAVIYFLILYFAHINLSLISILCGYLVGKAVRKGSGDRGGWVYQILAIGLTYLAVGMAYSGDSIAENWARVQANQFTIVEIIRVFVSLTIVMPVQTARMNIVALVIIVFALWEAWKLTQAAKLIVTGPYRLGDPEPEAGFEGVAGHA